MQRAVPGLDGMYRLVSALIASRARKGSQVLIVGAGGGREIESLGAHADTLNISAVDSCLKNLLGAKRAASEVGVSDKITFFEGTVDDLPRRATFDIATSLLVMHQLRDDGEKLRYLAGLRSRMAANGLLLHADVCFDGIEEFRSLIPVYLEHAKLVGVERQVTAFELETIPALPIISEARTRALFSEAGFAEPRSIFQSLWYRCWSCIRT